MTTTFLVQGQHHEHCTGTAMDAGAALHWEAAVTKCLHLLPSQGCRAHLSHTQGFVPDTLLRLAEWQLVVLVCLTVSTEGAAHHDNYQQVHRFTFCLVP
jgi:hypothetical protein